jgi:RNA polymerase sigma-70 factor, ECF subfamily
MLYLKFLPIGLAFGILQVALRFKEDTDMARRLKAREPEAMADLYYRYGRLVYSVVLRIVGDSANAEDLVQETFLRVWNGAQSFDHHRGVLGPWILAVARNRAIAYSRSFDNRMADADRLENPLLFRDFEDSALSAGRARRLRDAFQKLSPNQRTVIELAYYEGLSQTEISERMKQPLGTVKTWTCSALKLLRDQMAEAAIA